MENLILKEEAFALIGLCMEVHNNLGHGFLEVVYKDALQLELLKANIPFSREKLYEVNYKGIVLPHKFCADFVVFDKIILEIKGISAIKEVSIAQCINYLKVSELNLALLVNFGEEKLNYKRIVF